MIYGLLLWSIDAIAAAEWTPVLKDVRFLHFYCNGLVIVAAGLMALDDVGSCSVVLFGWCCLPVHYDCAELNAGPLWYDGMVGANVDVFSWFWYWSILLSSALCFCRANLCGSAACCSAFCCWLAAVVQQPMAMSCWSCWNAFWLLWLCSWRFRLVVALEEKKKKNCLDVSAVGVPAVMFPHLLILLPCGGWTWCAGMLFVHDVVGEESTCF
ncbi:hypothetical protein Nepgr_023953 [Nepenthes gracilis]|uniref:Transmembrane protein n=1 Tax=Nepenthes gracilis TaxID=150966 RepID=A0AAD3XZK5_NEPGR|nr:hypothetical protein Nepgr_023953 [Nepenthes gracilis]